MVFIIAISPPRLRTRGNRSGKHGRANARILLSLSRRLLGVYGRNDLLRLRPRSRSFGGDHFAAVRHARTS
jgi:hypothetical protein